MTMRRLLPLVSGCRPDEAPLVGRLWLFAFCLGLSVSLFRNAAQSLFLGSRDLDALLIAWLGSAGLSGIILAGFGRLQSRVSRLATCTALLGVFLGVILVVRLAMLMRWTDPAVIVGGYVAEVVYLLGALGFWPVATSLLDIRQGKRVFGFLATGEALAEILGGLAVPLVVSTLGVQALLDVAVLAVGAALVLARRTIRSHAATPVPLSTGGRAALGLTGLTRSSYLQLILAGYGLAIVSSYLLDYLFRRGVKLRSSSDSGEIATWLGLFSAAVNGLSLFTQVVVAPRLLERAGVRRILPVVPLAVTLGVLAALALSLAGVIGAAFIAVVGTRLCERVLTRGLQVPTIRVLYQAVPAPQRLGFQAIVEGTGNVALALVSVSLLLLREYVGPEGRPVLLVMAPVLLLWAWVSLALGRAYRRHLQARLARRQLGEAGFEADASAREVLASWLRRQDPGEVVQALRLVGSLPPDSALTAACAKLVTHSEATVRREAVLRLASSGESRWVEAVRPLVQGDPAVEVRAVAVQALAALGSAEALEPLVELADGLDEVLSRAALAGLLRYGGLEGVLAAGPRLMAWVGSQEPAQRAAAAAVLGEVGLPAFHRPLLALLRDPDTAVRRAALQASGEVRHAALWPAVCEQLARPDLRLAAVRALLRGGPEALPAVVAAADHEAGGTAEQRLLVRLAWRLGGRAAVPVLLRWADGRDLRVSVEALDALVRLGYAPSVAERRAQQDRVERELMRATDLVATAAALGDPDGLLGRALRLEWRWRAEAMLARLDLLEPSAALRDVRQQLREARGERGLAMEALEVLLPRDLGRALVTLLDVLPERERLERLAPWATPSVVGLWGRLLALWKGGEPSGWTRACLLYEIGRSAQRALGDVVGLGLQDADPLVRETAAWAAQSLEGRSA
ncbi:MAG TPA: HEAT repeat domain-containing protein [Gemmataceae bacterium]|nr:HEAT repeat domain-containing protein [Gemmataceae bacterium]